MTPLNLEPHITEEVIERYAIGSLQTDLIPAVEEHVLSCSLCQVKLDEADQFVTVFRAAATEVLETAPRVEKRSWMQFFQLGPVQWVGAMAAVVLAVGSFVASGISGRAAHQAPAVVRMQAFRGPESAATVAAGAPALLLFDAPAKVAAENCRLEIVDVDGAKVLETGTVLKNGRLEALAANLGPGAYWARLYRTSDNELLGEYSLRAERR